MNYGIVFRFLGNLALSTGLVFAPALLLAFAYSEYEAVGPFVGAILVSLAIGGAFRFAGRKSEALVTQREGLFTVSMAWFLVGALGALPYIFAGLMFPIPAFFESVSGFTTTGASTLDNIESFPKSILFWRAFTHWLGGVGIIVMFIAILPHLGAGGKHLFKSESSGPDARGLRPRIRQSAAILIGIYLVLTAINFLCLLATGAMGPYDAICHTFATLSTGGFSTKQASIAAFNSVAVEVVTIVFMVAGGTSFALYYELYRDRRISFLRNAEWRVYIMIMVVAAILITLNLTAHFGLNDIAEIAQEAGETLPEQNPPTFAHSLRAATFTVTSIMTSTGFATDDYDQWPYFSRMLLLLLMFVGGCAGSTGGGMKVVRVLMVVKLLAYRVERSFRPKIVRVLRISGQPVGEDVERDAATFVLAYMAAFGVGILLISALGAPFETSVTAVAACLTNVGPGLELVGPAKSYSILPDPALLILTGIMILGRLEVFTVLVLLMPDFWRRRR